MRRTGLLALLLGGSLLLPVAGSASAAAPASAAASVSDAQIAASVDPLEAASSVHPFETGGAIQPIDVSGVVAELKTTETEGDKVTVTISSDVLFAFDSAKLSANARQTIGEIATRLQKTKGTVHVDGYTDSIGSESYNKKLSRQRARAVASVLQKKLGDAQLTIVAKGHGEANPVAPNRKAGKDNPQGRAKNRRVEISYKRG